MNSFFIWHIKCIHSCSQHRTLDLILQTYFHQYSVWNLKPSYPLQTRQQRGSEEASNSWDVSQWQQTVVYESSPQNKEISLPILSALPIMQNEGPLSHSFFPYSHFLTALLFLRFRQNSLYLFALTEIWLSPENSSSHPSLCLIRLELGIWNEGTD